MTKITKPAGVGMQIIGALMAYVGVLQIVNAHGSTLIGLPLTAVGVWLFLAGRRPAVKR